MPRTASFEHVGAPDLAAGGLEPGERVGLLFCELVGLFEQRPARVLEALGGILVAEGAQLVPVVAADLIQRLVGELHHVVGVDADHRLRRVVAGGLRVAGAHVQRDRLELGGAREDRWLDLEAVLEPRALDAVASRYGRAGAERNHDRGLGRPSWLGGALGSMIGRRVQLGEEGVGGLLAFPCGAPHDLPAPVVGDEREVVVLLLPRHLVDGAFILHLRQQVVG